MAISIADIFTFEDGVDRIKCQTSYFAKNLVAQVMNEMSLENMQWKRKVWSKLMEALEI